MGRVKSLAIKRTTRKLLKEHSSLFNKDFEHNKQVLRKVIETDKKTKNSVAGYISRILKREAK